MKRRFLGQPARRLLRFVGVCAVIIGGASLAVTGYDVLTPASGHDTPSPQRVIRAAPNEVGGVYDRFVRATPGPPLPTAATAPPVDASAPAPAPVPVPLPAARAMPYRLVIDRIGVNAPVGVYGLDAKQIPEVPKNGQEVAWYKFTSEPGRSGNTVLAGHVTWGGRGVFYDLEDLKAGDNVSVVRQDGSRASYTVKEVFLVDARDPHSVSVMHATPTDVLTLITCGGSPYYIGGTLRYDYTHRLIVRASLVSGG